MRRLGVVLAVALSAAVVAAPARAAAPRYILVTGPGIDRPVLLDDWSENLRFLVALLPARRLNGFSPGHRPRYDLAFFWGVPERPVPTRPRDANQHATFYPAAKGSAAVVDLVLDGVRAPRIATPAALRILARHGIPTRR
jgi:hypothetical protein